MIFTFCFCFLFFAENAPARAQKKNIKNEMFLKKITKQII